MPVHPVKEYILRHVGTYPTTVVAYAMDAFSLSRPAVLRYVNEAMHEGLLAAEGTTRRRYRLLDFVDLHLEVELFPDSESAVWSYRIAPHLTLPENVRHMCDYGFTEMLNNAIDHSQSRKASILVRQNYARVEFFIIDRGVGIFEKIQQARGLASPQEALLELSKGKLTTYPAKHAGEGIYFTSRMFDRFIIRSGLLLYRRRREMDDDWLIEVEDRRRYRQGTLVYMRIATDASWSQREVFDKYQDDDLRFRRTHVPVSLALEPGQQLVSRSQAKRILARFEQFTEVLLDFKGVEEIGQGFADEVFRVFPLAHPNVPIVTQNTSLAIDRMIAFVKANAPALPSL